MILIFVILAGAGQLVTVQAKEEDHEIVVWYRPTASSSERYFELVKIDIDSGIPGTWEFWYSNDGVNYKKGYEDAKAGRASNPAKTVVKRPEQQTGRKPKTTSIYDLD